MLPTFSVFGISFITFPFIILLALAACVIVLLMSHQYKKFYIVIVFRMIIPMLAFAVVGARLTSAITLMQSSEKSFIYNFVFGGSVFYGGLIGGTIGLLLLCAFMHYDFLVFSDLFVTILPLGHAIGRLGCYLNGCCYGCSYSGLFAVNYIVDGVSLTVFPTWFAEALFCSILFIYFHYLHKCNTIGIRTAIYLLSYSIYRFLAEFVRGDEIRGSIGKFSSSQAISIFVLFGGLFVIRKAQKNNRKNYLFYERRA